MKAMFTIVSVTGVRAMATQDPDAQASQKMRGMGFVPSHGEVDSPHLHKDAKPEQGRNIHVVFEGEGNKGEFRLMDGNVVLDEGGVYDVQLPTPSIRTTTLFTNTGKSGLGYEFCCLPRTGNGALGPHKNGAPGSNRGGTPPPQPNPDPPPGPDPSPPEGNNPPANPEPPKPKRERKPRMPRPNKPTNLDRLLNLKSKMDERVATDSEIVETIIAEMGAEGKKGENLARIMKTLDRSNPWVYRYYQLRNLVAKLKPLIDEMGMPVAVEIAALPDFNQWNIWQKVKQAKSPGERLTLAKQLCEEEKTRTGALEKSAARNGGKSNRRAPRAHSHHGDEEIAAIEGFVGKLGEVDMNGGLTHEAFTAFVRSKTAGDLEATIKTLEASRESISKIITGVLTAYEEIAMPLLKGKH